MLKIRCGCGNVLTLSDSQEARLAGKVVKCPKCGTAKKLHPPEDRIPQAGPVGTSVGVSVGAGVTVCEKLTDDPSEELIVTPKRRKASWFAGMSWTKRLMLLTTILWPVFGVLFSWIVATGSFNRLRDFGNGLVILEGKAVTARAAWTRCISEGIVFGAMFSTMIYAALMFVLFVVWFATKPDYRVTR